MNVDKNLGKRKEKRFVVCDDERLQSETFIEFDDPIEGTVIDISPHGLRLLCQGSFSVGQAFVTELKTDRLHGVFPGIIRRISPWMDGKSVLGCQLFEAIPDDLLETLALEEVINRRDNDRVDWNQSAKMSWELQSGEVDIEVQDCSLGGLKIASQTAVPDNVCVRVRIEVGDGEHVTIDARTAWQTEQEYGCSMGLAFTKHEVPEVITRALAEGSSSKDVVDTVLTKSSMRVSIMIAATIVACGAAMWQTGMWG
jgi:hypothetical protein